MRLFVALVIMLAQVPNICCQGHEPQVGAIVATAATLQAIQIMREKSDVASNYSGSQDCCIVCEECKFPCGDICVSFGTFCTAPKGCACAQEPDAHRDMQMDTRTESQCGEYFFAPAPMDPIDM